MSEYRYSTYEHLVYSDSLQDSCLIAISMLHQGMSVKHVNNLKIPHLTKVLLEHLKDVIEEKGAQTKMKTFYSRDIKTLQPSDLARAFATHKRLKFP